MEYKGKYSVNLIPNNYEMQIIQADSNICYKGVIYSDIDLVGHEGQTMLVTPAQQHLAVYIPTSNEPILFCIAKAVASKVKHNKIEPREGHTCTM